MEYNMHVFPNLLVKSDSQIPIMVLTDTRSEKRALPSVPFSLLLKMSPLVSEEHQPWHAKLLLRLEDSQVHIQEKIVVTSFGR
jgi:hypothetical protein